jgi:hypothetical protein
MSLWRGPWRQRRCGMGAGLGVTMGDVDEGQRVWPRAMQRLRRLEVVHAAELYVVVIDGVPVRFSYEESLRLAFFFWRLYGDEGIGGTVTQHDATNDA